MIGKLSGGLIIAGIVVYFFFQYPQITADNIRYFVLSFGRWAPVIFILLFTVAPLVPFYSALLAVAGGLIFGLYYGSLLIMIGAVCGGSMGFYIARYCSHWWGHFLPKTKVFEQQKNMAMQNKISQHGFIVVLTLRLIPLIPFDLLSYMAGFSTIRYRDYMVATILGMIPGILVYANIGAQAMKIHSIAFYMAIGLLVLLTIITLIIGKSLQKRFNVA